jgi:hypothetical protein
MSEDDLHIEMRAEAHYPLCAACGQLWPCAESIHAQRVAAALAAIDARRLVFVHEHGGQRCIETTMGNVPIDWPEVRSALEAIGLDFSTGTMTFGPGPTPRRMTGRNE